MRSNFSPTAITCLVLTAACGNVEVRPDSQSGGDHERPGAKQLVLDKLTDDYVNAKEGDNTDWKYFKIKQKGILELTVYWDNRDVDAYIDVRDRFGALLDTRRHSAELEKDQIDIKVESGTHFLRLYTEKGASVYTIEAIFQPFDHSPEDDVTPEAVPLGGDFFGEPLPAPAPIVDKPGRRRRRRPANVKQPAATEQGVPVNGTIVRIIPGKRRLSFLTISLGKKDGITQGTKGWILDENGRRMEGGAVRVTRVGAKSSQAETPMTKEQIAQRRRVRLYVQ